MSKKKEKKNRPIERFDMIRTFGYVIPRTTPCALRAAPNKIFTR